MSRRRGNLATGLWWGTRYAMVYSLVGITVAIVRPAVLESYGLSLPELIGLYIAGGIGGGALTGFLLPLVRGQLSAAVVGFVVALPLMFMFAAAMDPGEVWSFEVTLGWILSAALLGPLCGAGVWRVMHPD